MGIFNNKNWESLRPDVGWIILSPAADWPATAASPTAVSVGQFLFPPDAKFE